jgi:hypothetical protein
MADHGNVEYATAPGNDYEAHEQTYLMFLKLVKWHVIVIPIILIVLAYLFV